MTQPKKMGGLGFKDLEIFNIFLLARQPWRTLTNPDSLSSKLLKAIYYPEGEFWDNELGSHPSQIWRTLLEGRDFMSKGLIRLIGDGRSTKIWNNNWLPRESSLGTLAFLSPDLPKMVSALIDEANCSWNTVAIDALFLPIDADVIKNIPIPTTPTPDFWELYFE